MHPGHVERVVSVGSMSTHVQWKCSCGEVGEPIKQRNVARGDRTAAAELADGLNAHRATYVDGAPFGFTASPPHYDELRDRECPGTTTWREGDLDAPCDTCGGRTGWRAPGVPALVFR